MPVFGHWMRQSSPSSTIILDRFRLCNHFKDRHPVFMTSTTHHLEKNPFDSFLLASFRSVVCTKAYQLRYLDLQTSGEYGPIVFYSLCRLCLIRRKTSSAGILIGKWKAFRYRWRPIGTDKWASRWTYWK